MFRTRPRHRAPRGATAAMQTWDWHPAPIEPEPIGRQIASAFGSWLLEVPVHRASQAWQAITTPA